MPMHNIMRHDMKARTTYSRKIDFSRKAQRDEVRLSDSLFSTLSFAQSNTHMLRY
jgi:hypothetical protein